MLRRYVLFSLFLILSLVVATTLQRPELKAEGVSPKTPGTEDPSPDLKFSHKIHVKDLSLDCATCHPAASTSKVSSENLFAGHNDCATCHEEQVTSSCDFCHKNSMESILPRMGPVREILFSHEQHLAMKGVECQTCHIGVDENEIVRELSLPAMATCNTCHNDHKATNTCETCHTNFVTLLPLDHQRSDFRRNHKEFARLGALDASCQTCHTESFCQQCHQSTGLKSFGQRDLMTEPRPKTWTKDSKNETILQNVHELNYRFTHGIDAKSRQADCAGCHSAQTFCAECHRAGGNITQGSFKPASHSVPGFTTLGFGSGGGLHAEEARRDIESCISCHDVEGNDPTCMTCHSENGRVR